MNESRRLRWISIALPILFIGAVENLRHFVFERIWPVAFAHLVTAVVVIVATYLFADHVWSRVRREQEKLARSIEALKVMEERERIGRELHDGLAQTLAYLGLRLKTVREQVRGGGDPAVLAALDEAVAVAGDAYAEVRASISDLKTVTDTGPEFVSVLRDWINRYTRHAGIPVELETDGAGPEFPPPGSGAQLIRIVQEALANVRKHAGAGRAWVRINRTGSQWQVVVGDDGRGFDPAAPSRDGRFGLQTMRERAEGIGGTLEIRSAPGRGTEVVVMLPAGRARG